MKCAHYLSTMTWAIQILEKELNYHEQNIRRKPTHYIRGHWTAASTLLDLISIVYRNLHDRWLDQRPQIAVPKLYNWATSSYCVQMTPNQLVVVIARLINLNVSCKISSTVYTVISTTCDWTSDHRLQYRNSTTEPLVHIACKWRQIN